MNLLLHPQCARTLQNSGFHLHNRRSFDDALGGGRRKTESYLGQRLPVDSLSADCSDIGG